MTNLTRKNQKVFASGASNNGQFGSLQATTKVLSNDVETLQALAAYEAGWNSAVVSGEQLPSLEEFQALNYINTYQTAYILQKGFPEWNTDTTYYIGDFTREIGGSKIYKSITDDNFGNALTDTSNWTLLTDFDELGNATTTSSGTSYLSNPITISNGTDADHDIDFTAGNFNFFDGSGQGKMTAKTGELDAAFGTGNGMLDTGTVTTDETYHLFPVYNPTTGDSKPLASLSKTSPTMTLPDADGYTVLGKRIAALRTDGSANIRGGTWRIGEGVYEFKYNTEINDITSNSATEDRTETPTLTCPPESKAFLSIKIRETSLGSGDIPRVIFTELSQDDVAPTIANSNLFIQGNSANLYANNNTWSGYTDSSGQIRLRTAKCDASVIIYGSVIGWKEYL